jgi:hypothetical protein
MEVAWLEELGYRNSGRRNANHRCEHMIIDMIRTSFCVTDLYYIRLVGVRNLLRHLMNNLPTP